MFFFFASKQEPDRRFRLEVQFHFLCSSYKLIFKCQIKMRERTCIAICRRERSGEDLIRLTRRGGKKTAGSKSKVLLNPGLNFLNLSGTESL